MKTTVYWVLLHSLWQGAVLAALACLLLLVARRAAPAVRYRLLTGLLALFAAGVGVTALCVAPHGASSQAAASVPSWTAGPAHAAARLPFPAAGLVGFLHAHATALVWAWALVVCFKGLRLAAGLRLAGQLKRQQAYAAGSYWQDRVDALAARLRIRQRVRLVQSALAKAPLVIGHLKPVILLPLGLVSQLPAAEVEAILCHELAHIRRRDFLVNLLQAALEVFFFFNPAVLWLNKLIRDEREHCCDDLALASSVTVRDYISALVSSSQTARSYHGAYALSFAGTRHELLGRVRRILHQDGARSRKPLRIALVFLALSAGAALSCLRYGSGRVRPTASKTRVATVTRVTTTTTTTTTATAPTPSKPSAPAPGPHVSKRAAERAATVDPVRPATPAAGEDAPAPPEAPATASVPFSGRRTGVQRQLFGTLSEQQPLKNLTPGQLELQVPLHAALAYTDATHPLTDAENRALLRELAADGLLGAGAEPPSYLLSDRELVVNAVKQPEPVYQKYRAKYVTYPGRTLLYNHAYTDTYPPAVTHPPR